jgi:hypothetical protein
MNSLVPFRFIILCWITGCRRFVLSTINYAPSNHSLLVAGFEQEIALKEGTRLNKHLLTIPNWILSPDVVVPSLEVDHVSIALGIGAILRWVRENEQWVQLSISFTI